MKATTTNIFFLSQPKEQEKGQFTITQKLWLISMTYNGGLTSSTCGSGLMTDKLIFLT